MPVVLRRSSVMRACRLLRSGPWGRRRSARASSIRMPLRFARTARSAAMAEGRGRGAGRRTRPGRTASGAKFSGVRRPDGLAGRGAADRRGGRSAGGPGLRDPALELQRLRRQLGVGGLGEEGVEAAAVVDAAQREAEMRRRWVWPSASLVSDTSVRFGRKRRLDLLLAWLTLLPTIGLLPVSSQRRDIGLRSLHLAWVRGRSARHPEIWKAA